MENAIIFWLFELENVHRFNAFPEKARVTLMSIDDSWDYPTNHPISAERAAELMGGELGSYYRDIMRRACSPFYWHAPGTDGKRHIRANGTLTYVRSNERTFGVTAHHVFAAYLEQTDEPGITLQLGDAPFTVDLIASSPELDLVTLSLPPGIADAVHKDIMPVPLPRPGDEPQEGRGIMLAGFVGEDRREGPGPLVGWGMLAAIGVARRVTQKQITWMVERERNIDTHAFPVNKELGGISGGPLIAWFEKAGGLLSFHSLAGIIVEANSTIENVVAIRAEYIRADGTLRPL